MKTILFQGDSITDCSRYRKATDKKQSTRVLYSDGRLFRKITALGDGYPAMVSAELEKRYPDGYKFYNRGIGGDKVTSVYDRMNRDILSLKPDVMSILVGVNDVWHRYDFGHNGNDAETYERVYDELLTQVKNELPELKIIIMGPFVLKGTATADREGQPDRFSVFSSEVARMAAIAKRLAEKHGCSFVDLQSVFAKAAETVPAGELLSDGVHPTEKGHRLIAAEWLKAFGEQEGNKSSNK